MPKTVPAAVLVKPRTLEAREFPRPVIGSDDALLRIEACGICGSDYEQYEGAQSQHEDYTPYPVIPGHEPLGVIEEIGADDTFRAIELIESGRYPFERMHTMSLPLEQAEDAIHALAGHIEGVNPIHLAIVPGAPRMALRT